MRTTLDLVDEVLAMAREIARRSTSITCTPPAPPAARVAERLREAIETEHHAFVPDDLSLLDVTRFDTEQLLGHRQVTDAYLLGLAIAQGLRLVTLDASIALRVVRGAVPGPVVSL